MQQLFDHVTKKKKKKLVMNLEKTITNLEEIIHLEQCI